MNIWTRRNSGYWKIPLKVNICIYYCLSLLPVALIKTRKKARWGANGLSYSLQSIIKDSQRRKSSPDPGHRYWRKGHGCCCSSAYSSSSHSAIFLVLLRTIIMSFVAHSGLAFQNQSHWPCSSICYHCIDVTDQSDRTFFQLRYPCPKMDPSFTQVGRKLICIYVILKVLMLCKFTLSEFIYTFILTPYLILCTKYRK